MDQIIAIPILKDQVATLATGPVTIRPIYVRKRSDRDTRRGDTLLFLKEYHFNLGALLYTSSWLGLSRETFSEVPTEGNVARVERSDVIRYTNDYYTYESGRPLLQDEQSPLKGRHGQTVVVHNHLSYWTPVFKETWSFFPQHAPYQKNSQNGFREELWEAAKSGYLCDVLIQGDGFEIPAHCIVLRTVPYYKVMFASMLSEGLESRQRHYQPDTQVNGFKEQQLEFTDHSNPDPSVQILQAPPFASEHVLRGFLFYVYMGRLPLDVFGSSTYALDMILLGDFYNCSDVVRDAVHAVRMDDPSAALDVAESIEQNGAAEILRDRASRKLQSLGNGVSEEESPKKGD